MITSFNINTKKGESQWTRWLISQEIPHPQIHSEGTLNWRNGEGLFPRYGNPATGLAERYYCYLLRSDIDVAAIPENYGRAVFAGFTEYNKPGALPAPGTIKFRGKDLGEMTIYFGNNPDWPDIRIRCNETPSGGEREMITAQIIPPLKFFINQSKAALRANAVERVRKRIDSEFSDTQGELKKLREEADTALALISK